MRKWFPSSGFWSKLFSEMVYHRDALVKKLCIHSEAVLRGRRAGGHLSPPRLPSAPLPPKRKFPFATPMPPTIFFNYMIFMFCFPNNITSPTPIIWISWCCHCVQLFTMSGSFHQGTSLKGYWLYLWVCLCILPWYVGSRSRWTRGWSSSHKERLDGGGRPSTWYDSAVSTRPSSGSHDPTWQEQKQHGLFVWLVQFLLLHTAKTLSVESQKGVIIIQWCSVETQKGANAVQSLWQ